MQFIFNGRQKAGSAFPPHLPRTAFNYFAYYCVLLSDKNKAELITNPEMRNLNH